VNESDWISRNYRGDLIEHYKRALALIIPNGILFEFYEEADAMFVRNILKPALEAVEKEFGIKPLICNLVPEKLENVRNWNSYPSVLYPIVKAHYQQKSNAVSPLTPNATDMIKSIQSELNYI
jgi:hypothetical protein